MVKLNELPENELVDIFLRRLGITGAAMRSKENISYHMLKAQLEKGKAGI